MYICRNEKEKIMKNLAKTFIIRDSEAGNAIEECNSIQEAQNLVIQFEIEYKEAGTYIENFYEIV